MRHRRRTLATGAVLLVPATLLALRYPTRGWGIALHLAWMGLLVGAALLSRRGALATAPFQAAALLSAAAATAVVAATGGTNGPRFGFLLALPPIVLVVVPELPWAAGLAGAACLAGGVVLILADGRGGWFLVEWLVLSLTTSALSVVGAVGFGALWARELETQRRHVRTVAQLAESERRRERAERLVSVARLAARLAHDVANPLAAVKANVAWLADAGPDAKGTAELGQVVADTRASVERIGQIAAELRQLAKLVPAEAESFDVAHVLAEALDGVAEPAARVVLRAPGSPQRLVANRALVVQCVRHLVSGGAALAPAGAPAGALRLEPRRLGAEVAIDLAPAGRGPEAADGGEVVDAAHAISSGPAGLHLAIVAELALAVEGRLETRRGSDGVWHLRVRLPAPPP